MEQRATSTVKTMAAAVSALSADAGETTSFGHQKLDDERAVVAGLVSLAEELAVQIRARLGGGNIDLDTAVDRLRLYSETRLAPAASECTCEHLIGDHTVAGCQRDVNDRNGGDACPCVFRTGYAAGQFRPGNERHAPSW